MPKEKSKKQRRVKLTVKRIDDLQPNGDTKAFLRDSEVPGLAVVAFPSGAKSFVFEARMGRRTMRTTIGSISSWRIPDAREEARRRRRLVDCGVDPRQEKKEKEAAERREELLFGEVWKAYLKAHNGKWSARHMADNLYLAKKSKEADRGGVILPLLSMRVAEIDASVLIRWANNAVAAHEARLAEVAAIKKAREAEDQEQESQGRVTPIRGRNTALRQGFVRIRACWNWAHQREEYVGAMAAPVIFKHSDLRALIPRLEPKNDVLERGQLSAWFGAVRSIENPIISAYLQILLMIGCRRNELSELKWSDIDSKWKAIWLKDKVEEQGRKVPLTPYCDYLISTVQKRNQWVFSSLQSDSGHLVEPRIAHKRALEVAGLPSDLTLHGLRRSFTTLSEWIEMPSGVAAQLCGHRPSAVQEKHYRRRPLDLLAQWHTKFEKWILEQAGIQFNPEATGGKLQIVKENNKG